MVLNLIVACCKGGGIGLRGALPWSLKHDMRHFKAMTSRNNNAAIIMGKNTWLSLSKCPLPHRANLVLSSTLPEAFSSKKALDEHCLAKKYEDVWVIGGENVYRQYIDEIDMVYMTQIHKNYYCDTFFPLVSLFLDFKLVDKSFVHKENGIPFQYYTYKRK